jgi:hypothetical protein
MSGVCLGPQHDLWPVKLQIAELNRHIDNMHQREEEYRRRVQVRLGDVRRAYVANTLRLNGPSSSVLGVQSVFGFHGSAALPRSSQSSWRYRARTKAKPSKS